MTLPQVLEMFQRALRASWDDNVPRLGASLADYTHHEGRRPRPEPFATEDRAAPKKATSAESAR